MMACGVCEHCQNPVSRDEVTMREGFSYHKRCHKCYVCSETDLLNAEVFQGVIFCSGCAQRIFQGCATARRTKNMHNGRSKRTRSKSHKRRERPRFPEPRRLGDGSRDGVIEMAGLGGSTTDSDDLKKQKRKPSAPTILKEIAAPRKEVHEENCYYLQRMKEMKKDSTEMGTTTDVTQELLRQINCPVPECRAPHVSDPCHFPRTHVHRRKEMYESERKPTCSDLRIAELGASTEIANMTLRKKSELPVIIKSDTRMRPRESYSLSILNQESDISGDGQDWLDSNYTLKDSQRTRWMDRKLGSIMRLPINFFKRNILERSSLISILMSSSDEKSVNLYKRLKEIFVEEVTEHQARGVTRLYSTINRRKRPYKLGWVELVAKVSKVLLDQQEQQKQLRSKQMKRCKHFKTSHSYRCMRAQVMKLAGPTKSELACYRNKIKKFVAPQFLRNIVTSNKNYPAIKMSQCCGSDRKPE
ncbi:uncharacterized protein LOC113502463 isoform X2 [Trichoplusia ni]|uniref:Uncharacterized protein LOC113502463 isoform X2 n=1 Tax=Trichoplusia ni TaxID=7111 RepID=A0A7E5WGL3_TRINI|nr:uncharacterized protein LOC113502463 isoform X2 [Trichoplusia ni]